MSWRFYPAAQLSRHADAWRALHARGPASPLLDLDFVAPLLAAFGSGTELLAIYEQDGVPAAMVMLTPTGPGAWASFQPAQAPVGLWLTLPGIAPAPLLDALLRALPGCALVAGISQLDPALDPRPRDGRCIQTLDYIDTARITLDGGFDVYWQQRGKNLRANLKKQRARLGNEGIATRLELLRAPQQMAQAVADYARLEAASWKGRTMTAVQAGDAQERFYRSMLEAFAQRGRACVYRYWFGEQLAAMDLCVESHDCIVVLKTTYDETIPAAYSPAMLMREEACRQLFDDGRFARLEFYGRVMDWHLRWTSEVRSLYHLNHYRWPLLRRLHALKRGRAVPEPVQPESHLE